MTDKDSDIEFEIKFYQGLLQKNPSFPDALAALGDLYTKNGQYKEGLEIDLKLAYLKPEDPIVLYNLACSYSLLQDTDKSLESIKQAVEFGYNDIRHLERDGDLTNLRKDEKFKKYLVKIKAKGSSQD